MTDERRETAHHEAAHAVTYFWYDVPFRKVTIRPDKKRESLGHVAFTRRRLRWKYEPEGPVEERRRRLRMESEIVALYAGAWGEATLKGGMPEDGHAQDDEDAVALASRLFYETEELDAFLRFCFLQARNFVRTPVRWVEIQAVAEALLERETLTRDQVRLVIADIPPERFGEARQAAQS